MKFVLLFCWIWVLSDGKPVNEPELPHSREFYAGYIKAITDNFDQLFENDRETRSTKDEVPDKILQKRAVLMGDEADSNLNAEESGDESGDIENVAASGFSEDPETVDDNKPGESVQQKNSGEQKDLLRRSNRNLYLSQKNKVGQSSKRSEEEVPSFEGGDGSDDDIRASATDMQRASRDQSPEDLAKISHSTITFLPTNVRNYKSTPFVARLFHYNPVAIPFGDFPQESGPGEMGSPYARQFLQSASFKSEFVPQRFMFDLPFHPSYFTPYDRESLVPTHDDMGSLIMRRTPDATANSSPVTAADAKSAPEANPLPAAIPAANPAPVANTNNNNQGCCCQCCCCPCCCCCNNNNGGNNNNNNNCCCCCHHCHHHCHHCCHHSCCCCQPIHHITHHHHCYKQVCHQHHHHHVHDHELKVHPHHEYHHHCHDHCHTHPHFYNHVHHHTPVHISCNDYHCQDCGCCGTEYGGNGDMYGGSYRGGYGDSYSGF